MLEYLILAIALGGTALAGWIDLKTTEIPDYIPLVMGVSGVMIHGINSYLIGNYTGLYYSLATGIGFLVLGYILYFLGQWGEADAIVLGALGFLIPYPLAIFNIGVSNLYPLIFIANTFVVGAIYSFVYASIIALRTPNILQSFISDMKTSVGSLSIIFTVFVIFSIIIAFVMKYLFNFFSFFYFINQFLSFLLVILVAFSIYRFAVVLDKTAFMKKIKTKNLRIGDVLAEDISKIGMSGKLFKGLEKNDIKKIQKARKQVLIKEGVRYSPTFFFAILATWFYGNLMFMVVNLL